MKYGSVCSGIEAATVAWHSLGWKPVWFAEIEKFPSKVLAYHYPNVPNLGDMTKLNKNETYSNTDIDLLVGGTPCRSFSIAGLRGGLDDDRGNLALEFCRILLAKQPRWFVWENVPGVFSSNGGEDFATILRGFRECGYSCAYRVIDSQYFGVPQRRRRVFVVGYLGDDWRPPAAVLFERESLRRDLTPSRKKGQEVAGTLDARTSGGGFPGSDGAMNGHVVCQSGDVSHPLTKCHSVTEDGNGRGIPVVAQALTASSGRRGGIQNDGTNIIIQKWPADLAPTLNAHFGSKQGLEDQHVNSGCPLFVPYPTELCSIMPQNSGKDYKARQVDVTKPLMAGGPAGGNQGGDYVLQPAVFMAGQGAEAGSIAYSEDSVPTLRSSQSGSNMVPSLHSGTMIRRLTPLECERLQGFPDNYTNIPGASDSARYAAIGNSMTVQVMRWIGERIKMVGGIVKKLKITILADSDSL